MARTTRRAEVAAGRGAEGEGHGEARAGLSSGGAELVLQGAGVVKELGWVVLGVCENGAEGVRSVGAGGDAQPGPREWAALAGAAAAVPRGACLALGPRAAPRSATLFFFPATIFFFPATSFFFSAASFLVSSLPFLSSLSSLPLPFTKSCRHAHPHTALT